VREKTGLSKSTIFYHLGRFYNRGEIEREKGRYCLARQKRLSEKPEATLNASVNFLTSNWDILLSRAEKAGGFLIEVEFGKLDLGDPDPITGHFKRIYDKKPIQGILVLEGALNLQRAIGLDAPRRYGAFFLTKSSAEEADWVRFKEKYYYVEDVKPIVEGVDFSYNIFIMAERRKEELFDSDPDLPQ
jgi:hypothetical protein